MLISSRSRVVSTRAETYKSVAYFDQKDTQISIYISYVIEKKKKEGKKKKEKEKSWNRVGERNPDGAPTRPEMT